MGDAGHLIIHRRQRASVLAFFDGVGHRAMCGGARGCNRSMRESQAWQVFL